MPTNEQRRETAKRKLERQLETRAKKARRRQQLTIAGSVLGVILLVGAIVLIYVLTKGDDDDTNDAATTTSDAPTVSNQAPGQMPAGRSTPFPASVNCTYTPTPEEKAAKDVQPPKADGIDTTVANVSVSMTTSQGNLGLTLNNAESPCTVNNFVSLASQGYFDGTKCHRMTTADTLKVLQCGDPTALGTGGPGYKFANEFPTDQYAENDPGVQVPVNYKRGTIAMANAGPGTNGSQFFLVFGDSQLPPMYTIFGTIDETGLATLDKIAAGGVTPGERGPQDGAPAQQVDITSVALD